MSCGAEEEANRLLLALTEGEDFTLPDVDMTGPAWDIPGGDDSPENKAPQSEFSKGFSRMLEVQRELAATPPAKRNELLAKKNSEALANIFKPMFGEDE